MSAHVVNHPEQSRYEVFVDGALAGFAEYEIRPDTPQVMALTHTEVDQAFAGQGLAGLLAAHVMADLTSREMSVLPFCAYMNGYLTKHPEHVHLVPEDKRERFNL